MKGADYIAAFLAHKGVKNVFLMTGGAAAFIIDSIGRHPELSFVCFHHEQSAAMAADAVWRISRQVGVTVATSGPGATNLITGIACSYFDSIPSFHITGQVNMKESAAYLGAAPRQAGFQETKIVEMVTPITKYAVQVRTAQELKSELEKAWKIATSGRMGPVLIDVPMDVQQMDVGEFIELHDAAETNQVDPNKFAEIHNQLAKYLDNANRPLVYFGAGVGLAGVEKKVEDWLIRTRIPFVSSWNGMTYFKHDINNYCGSAGIYGSRTANFLIQNCDLLLVFGSRLDNRQRSSNTKLFAQHAKVVVIDIDVEELNKYKSDGYETICMDLKYIPSILEDLIPSKCSESWLDYAEHMKQKYFGKNHSTYAQQNFTQSPYEVVNRINNLLDRNAIIINDTGAALCWFFQAFHRDAQTIFTAGGNSPMGYALPAAIGAKLIEPSRQVICVCGDGGFQLNIQELAVLKALKLDITIIIFNNGGYGIIKQFQDSNLEGRYFATGEGYCLPDFKGIVEGYGLKYFLIDDPKQIHATMLHMDGGVILDVILDPNTTVEPKVERGRLIQDQSPFMSDEEFNEGNAFIAYERLPS